MDVQMPNKDFQNEFAKKIVALKQQGKFPEIVNILDRQGYDLHSQTDALFISEMYEKSGDVPKAYKILAEYLNGKSASVLSLRYLGFLCACQKDYLLAARYLEEAQEKEPKNADIYQELGKLRLAANRTSEALEALQFALKNNAKNKGSVLNDLSSCMRQLGRHDEEIDYARKAIKTGPEKNEYKETLANALLASGEKEEAFTLLDGIIFSDESRVSALYNLIRSKKFSQQDKYYDLVLKLLEDPQQSSLQKTLLNYAAGHIASNLGDYQDAVNFWNSGGILSKSESQFSFIQEQQKFMKIYQTFGQKIPKVEWNDLSEEIKKQKPIFIVGMPRSGTTLLESIISSHSMIQGAGELENLGQIFNGSNFFELKSLLHKNMVQIRALYHNLNRYRIFKKNIFTDKMPLNFRFIGYILNAFPDAKIIHIKRDPVATCFSNFQRNFKADGMTFTATQTDIAKYYKLYVDLMDFWNNLYKGKFLEIQYEDLTEDIETKSQEIFKFLELDYETQVLNFHKQKRSVLTASQDQVRLGIYKNSSKAWKNYEPWLSPMLDQLNKDQII